MTLTPRTILNHDQSTSNSAAPPLLNRRTACWIRRLWVLALVFVALPCARAALEDEIRAFETNDVLNAPPLEAIVFTGSSSVRMWSDLETTFTNHVILNRGFGGSQMSDLLHYLDRVVVPYQPALVVAYEGDNDLASGKSVDQVFADYTNFLARVEQQLPNADVALMAVKPSPSRASLLTKMRELNQRLEGLADGLHIRFIDVFTPLLNASGQPRPELFLSDMLHLNTSGYQIWRAVVGPALDSWAMGRGQTFFIDFGAAGSPTTQGPSPGNDPLLHWNNVNEQTGTITGQSFGLSTVEQKTSSIRLEIVSAFNGANENGTPSSSIFPGNATRDSLYGNTEPFNGRSNIFPALKFTGLDKNLNYRLEFFASRTGASDNRETGYTVAGSDTSFASLNAANNVSNTAVLTGITASTNGTITVSLAPTTNNTSANHFTYLGVMRFDVYPPQTPILFAQHPTNQAVTAYESVTFSASVIGARPYFVQWWSNGLPLPGANSLSLNIPEPAVTMDDATFSVSVSNLIYGAHSAPAVLHVLADTNPPVLLNVSTIDGIRFELQFNEPLRETATITTNYRVNGLAPLTAELVPGAKVVFLTQSEPILGTFLISVNGVTDLAGNPIAPTTEFTGVIPQPVQQTFFIDFGGSAVTTRGPTPDDPANYWNNITETIGASSTAALPNLVTSSNEVSTVNLVMTSRFNGANLNGTIAAAPFPRDATSDSLFGNTELFNNLTNIFPGFTLTGLNTASSYDLTFYASRTGVSDNRETQYTVVGTETNVTWLNAANNVTNQAVIPSVRPSSSGEIAINLRPGPRNNNGNHFTYLSTLKIVAIPPLRLLPPRITEGQIELDWPGEAQLESAVSLHGPWTPVSVGQRPYREPVQSGQTRLFRLRR